MNDLLAMDELVERHTWCGLGRAGSRFVTAPGGSAKHDAVKSHQLTEGCSAEAQRLLEHRIEHRQEIAGRGIDNLQYLGRRSPLLQCFARLGDQPRILDRNDRLIGKCAHLGLIMSLLLLSGVNPARAASTAVTSCGQILAAAGDYELTGDLGPCKGDGVVIAASGVHLTWPATRSRG